MNSLIFPKSIQLIPVEREHLKLLSALREKHPAWKKMSPEQVSRAFEEKWSGNGEPCHWLITVRDRVYGEIGWKSYTPGEHVYLELIVYRKELYSLDLAKNLITPFVRLLLKKFRIHTVRFTLLRPDRYLEMFLGAMRFRSLGVRTVPARGYFPGGVVASYEVEGDHLLYQYGKILKIQWKSFQLIPFKLLDVDSAPVDFSPIIIIPPGRKERLFLKNRQDLEAYFQSLSPSFEIRTILEKNEEGFLRIGAVILHPDYPEGLIWHPRYQSRENMLDLFACLYHSLREYPVLRSPYVHTTQADKISLLRTFNFIQDSQTSDGYSLWHLETVALPDKDELLKIR